MKLTQEKLNALSDYQLAGLLSLLNLKQRGEGSHSLLKRPEKEALILKTISERSPHGTIADHLYQAAATRPKKEVADKLRQRANRIAASTIRLTALDRQTYSDYDEPSDIDEEDGSLTTHRPLYDTHHLDEPRSPPNPNALATSYTLTTANQMVATMDGTPLALLPALQNPARPKTASRWPMLSVLLPRRMKWKWTLHEAPNAELPASAQPDPRRWIRQKPKPLTPPTPGHTILPFSRQSRLRQELGEDDAQQTGGGMPQTGPTCKRRRCQSNFVQQTDDRP